MIRYNVRDVNGSKQEIEADTTSITNNGDLLFLVTEVGEFPKHKLVRAYAKGVWVSVEIDEEVVQINFDSN